MSAQQRFKLFGNESFCELIYLFGIPKHVISHRWAIGSLSGSIQGGTKHCHYNAKIFSKVFSAHSLSSSLE